VIGEVIENFLDRAVHVDGLAELDHLNKIMPGRNWVNARRGRWTSGVERFRLVDAAGLVQGVAGGGVERRILR